MPGAIASAGDRPLPSTMPMPVLTPSRRSSEMTACAAPLNEAGSPAASATWRARFSAITLLLSCSICSTMADSGGEVTLARTAAPGRARSGPRGIR